MGKLKQKAVQHTKIIDLEEEIVKINSKVEKDLFDVRDKCLNIIEKNRKKIKQLEKTIDEVEEFLKCREEELENARHNMIQELLRQI